MRIFLFLIFCLPFSVCRSQFAPDYIPMKDTAYLKSLQNLSLQVNERMINRSNRNDNRIFLFTWWSGNKQRNVGKELRKTCDKIANRLISILKWSDTISEMRVIPHSQHYLGEPNPAFCYKLNGHKIASSFIDFSSEPIGGTLPEQLKDRIRSISLDSNRTLFTHIEKNGQITFSIYSFYDDRKYKYWELERNNDVLACARTVDAIFTTIPQCSEIRVFYFGRYGASPGGVEKFEKRKWQNSVYKLLLELSRQKINDHLDQH